MMKENAEVARRQVQELILERAKAENAMNEALAELAETKRALAKLKVSVVGDGCCGCCGCGVVTDVGCNCGWYHGLPPF